MDHASEMQLNWVHPELVRRVRLLAQKCEENNIIIRVSRGLRTYAEQDALYEQGRTTPGEIVTHAKGGYSAHNFAYAVDIVPGKDGFPVFTPDWDGLDIKWKNVLMLGRVCHLAEGAQWRTLPVDKPHFYLEELPATPTDAMRTIFNASGMQAVWDSFVLNGDQ